MIDQHELHREPGPPRRGRCTINLWRLLTVIAIVVGGAASEAAAEDDPLAVPTSPRALQHFDAGAAAFEAGDYQRAIAEYEAGAQVEDQRGKPFKIWARYFPNNDVFFQMCSLIRAQKKAAAERQGGAS